MFSLSKWRQFCLLSYITIDLSLSIFFLGFFTKSLEFSFKAMSDQFLFKNGYKFTSSAGEFYILSIVRSICMTLRLILSVIYQQLSAKTFSKSMLLLAVFCYCFAFVKLLALSEVETQLTYPGVWLSVIWTIISSILFALIWTYILGKMNGNYEQLDEDNQRTSVPTDSNVESGSTPRLSTSKHIIRMMAYCKGQAFWFLSGFSFLFIHAILQVFIPNMMGTVIADIVKTRGLDALFSSVMAMIILTAIRYRNRPLKQIQHFHFRTIFDGLQSGCLGYAGAKVSKQVRKDLFSSLVQQEIAFFDSEKSAEMVSRLTSDCQTVSSAVSSTLNWFLTNFVMLVGSLGYMFYKSWRLTTVSFIMLPAIYFVTQWFGETFDKIAEEAQKRSSEANHAAEEVLSTMRTVRSFACEKRESKRFCDLLDKTLNVSKRRSIFYIIYTWINELCDNAILVIVLFYGGHLAYSNQMSPEDLITFLLYQLRLSGYLYSIGYVFTSLMETVGASRKVFEYMIRVPAIPNDGILQPAVKGKLELKDVSFTYPSRPNNPVLKNLNLTINAGETVALVGPSGGGKSSIVSLIQHFYEPDQGSILLDDILVKDIDHAFYHQKIAMVAQEPILYDGTVRYNILYGCDWATEEDMLTAAKLANVHGFVSKLEKGYDTQCGEKGIQMSGGQKQRIAIARALVRRPAVLILDEATSALDSESETVVQDAINQCSRERTVLIIAHRLSTVERADRIAVVEYGRIAELGNHSDLMDLNGIYASLVSRQLLGNKKE